MVFHTYIPSLPLSRFIDFCWLYQGCDRSFNLEHVLPDGCAELIINLHEDKFRVYNRNLHHVQTFFGSILSGSQSEYVVIDTASQVYVMGVHFKPGGLFPFLSFPASEVHDQVVSLDTLWGTEANELRDQLLDADTPEIKFRLMEQFMFSMVRKPLQHHPAVSYALKEMYKLPGMRSTADLSQHLGFSKRHFIQMFCNEVGVTPKLFGRIRRFQEVLHLIHRGEQINWGDIVFDCGYYDQAHFNHDFRAFSGLNPTTYMKHQSEHRNHVPLVQ
ncbi:MULTISPECIES: helix-turn-helix domain-containing protein [Paenibacillus]|uniref:Transcriptional regulator, AraC family n=2 Tax=Paenibacillus lactis TaxID=228574 RepID=G4HJ12_9BACL|nr:helix-turn-helix domain-containing protein [Paenibacillus lactis]EHB62730.1 transcriptional regulator, AraC family [Paenibacillus lactis 154]